ncbi:hypothetical protein B0H15DRAFT_832290 [Mycena belliarum]|uniref:Uncharacterized protein n=1 Tax=Mycena belliarum TaxID=1033014 RepID=A0AAD6U831_9AGAR|nr:hypothetical protein B0H15DRAFT_832290 [Mycena belliae]
MSAPQTQTTPRDPLARPVLGHVNLMADTLIANATLDDLRAIVRSMVASATPGVAAALTAAARDRLAQTHMRTSSGSGTAQPPSGALFTPHGVPTTQLHDVLRRARALYGSGMGFASLGLLACAVRATVGLRWERDGATADILAVIDADIGQAIQSCKEEADAGRAVGDRRGLHELRGAVAASAADVAAWGGEFPFERAAASLEFWNA